MQREADGWCEAGSANRCLRGMAFPEFCEAFSGILYAVIILLISASDKSGKLASASMPNMLLKVVRGDFGEVFLEL